jgi:hypothetical protein
VCQNEELSKTFGIRKIKDGGGEGVQGRMEDN